MATSFTKKIQSNASALSATPSVASYVEEPLLAAYAGEETFTRSSKYLWYDNYKDNSLSYIDEDRNITVDPSQLNITQEKNSQYIPFEMDRHSDGIDLTEMSLLIHFVNKEGFEGFSVPINVSYSDTKIRFGFLVPSK